MDKIWCMRAGADGGADRLFLKRNQIAISFAEVDDDASKLPVTRSAFKEAFARANPNARPGSIPIAAGQLYRFVHEMRIGDLVIYPRKVDRTLHWGRIDGPYIYDTDYAPTFAHRRDVRWLGQFSRDIVSQGALYELGSVLTLFEVKSFAEELHAKFLGQSGEGCLRHETDEANNAVVYDTEETTKDFICKQLKTHLKGYAMEPFVAELFRAMGYRAKATRQMRDDGIDVIAHRDELGIEPPILKIQVKAHNAAISADIVKAFYAMIHERDVGIFITTGSFTASARDFARTRGNLKLVDGVVFVDLIQKYYDALSLKYRQIIPLRRVLVPDVAESDA